MKGGKMSHLTSRKGDALAVKMQVCLWMGREKCKCIISLIAQKV